MRADADARAASMRTVLLLALALCGAALVAPLAVAGTCDLCHAILGPPCTPYCGLVPLPDSYPCQPFCDVLP
jgi:hypothetical protein